MWSSVLPLLVTISPALLFLPDHTNTQDEHWQDYKYGRQQDSEVPDKKSFCSWKCLLFTLQWPGAFCQSLDEPSLCKIPQNVNNWTIHGLWPLRVRDCCKCWPMFKSDVQDLEAELQEHWPSLLQSHPSFLFWLLEVADISPSCERPYKLSEVHQALAPLLGEKLQIQCVTDDQEREVWFQVKIPLSHNLTVGCDHHVDADPPHPPHGHPCHPQTPFYYFPIDHQQPQTPCG
ncbi:ribonuclease T2-like isoform X2 [Eleginops maclovinus]|uniref:ribonuclease T2-like isoform X2 n=1 Tax=Eleginops maclovinus TaxID=56733 RepID=UPI00308020AC